MQPTTLPEGFTPHDLDSTNLTLQNSQLASPFVTAYGPKYKSTVYFINEGVAKQSFKEECDINTIMSRYQATGQLPNLLNREAPNFVDVSGYGDFQEAMNDVASAQSLFNQLPSAVRARFRNDPGYFLEFAENPANQAELVAMGLGRPKEGFTPQGEPITPTIVAQAPMPAKAPAKGNPKGNTPPNLSLPNVDPGAEGA